MLESLLKEKKLTFPLLTDGAMGSELIAQGFHANSCLVELNIQKPQSIQKIHRAYYQAGAKIIYTHTFLASKQHLKLQAKETLFDQINKKAVDNARQAVSDQALVAGCMTGFGPNPNLNLNQRTSCFHEHATLLAQEGVDLFIVETITYKKDLIAAIQACTNVKKHNIPLMISIVPDNEGALMDQTPLSEWLPVITKNKVDIIGFNCFFNLNHITALVSKLSKAGLPLLMKPNAGMPQQKKNQWLYPVGPKEFCIEMKKLLKQRVAILGGCCGTTPKHIHELAKSIFED